MNGKVYNKDLDRHVPVGPNGETVTRIGGTSNIIGNDPRGLVPISEPTLLTIPTYDGSGQAVHPSVVHIPGGFGGYAFWMVMTPYPNSDATKENPSILASNDGLEWVVPPGVTNPLFGPPATSNFSDPHLEYDFQNNQLVLYWQHNSDGMEYRSTSADGVTWTAAVAVGNLGTSVSFVKPAYNRPNWIAFSADLQRLYRRESVDGLTFDNPQYLDIPTIGQAGHVWVGIDDVGYHMLIQQTPRNRAWANSNINYAFSLDGYDWQLFPSPVIGRTIKGERARAVYRSCMVNLGGFYRVYYSAWSETGEWRLGYFDAALAFSSTRSLQGTLTVPLYNQLAIRDIAAKYAFSGNLNGQNYLQMWNRYQHRAIIYHNAHDQPLTLSWLSNLRGERTLQDAPDILMRYAGGTPTSLNYNLPAGNIFAPVLITEADMPILGQKLPTSVSLYVKAGTAPISGDISAKLVMWN
jgi:hypothetical protein